MNGRVLFDFMYDQFVWPKHPFASRDVRHREGSPVSQEAAGEPSPCRDETMTEGVAMANHGVAIAPGLQAPAPSVIVLADRRRKETT